MHDFRCAHNVIIPWFDKEIVETDIALRIIALWHYVGARVIDTDCTENVCVVLFKRSNLDYYVRMGDRIVQSICQTLWFVFLQCLLKNLWIW